WLLALCLVTVGPPFFAVAAGAPLLQKWFADTGHSSARDPYFLYAASNVGSLLALVAYPLLVEPTLTLSAQRWLWTAGYLMLAMLTAACAVLLWRARRCGMRDAEGGIQAVPGSASRVPLLERLRWVLLAFVPSSLMLSVTTYLTTDVAALPLMWVLPLALYLLSFILVFARRPPVPHAVVVRWLPLAVLVVAVVMLSPATEPARAPIPPHPLGPLA